MEIHSKGMLLRVFVGESDRAGHVPLYEAIVREARAAHLAGATAWRGMLSYGATARIRTAKVLDLSTDLPMVVEIVDEEAKLRAFLPTLERLFDESRSGALVTLEKVEVIRYKPGANGG